jgi:hypothetical protein
MTLASVSRWRRKPKCESGRDWLWDRRPFGLFRASASSAPYSVLWAVRAGSPVLTSGQDGGEGGIGRPSDVFYTGDRNRRKLL